MGIIIGTWFIPPSYRKKDDLNAISVVAMRLRTATGLGIYQAPNGSLVLSRIRESLFDWQIEQDSITVHGFAPAHPYLWENLDGVMTLLGNTRDTTVYKWRPNPAYERLRTRWTALPKHDRLILSLPSILGRRTLDSFLKYRN